MNHQALVNLALQAGATKAEVMDGKRVVTNAVFRDICESNGCGSYGRCYMCPPHVGEIQQLMVKVHGYAYALIYQTISDIEDSFDIEGMLEAGTKHAWVSQRLQEMLEPSLREHSLHLTCGGCRLCDTCALVRGEPCVRPGKALPSMESYGVDVYNTVKDTQLKYINGQNTVTFFGMLLYDGT